jgi:peptidoglycan/xylan/chitin deacetylase (PgdA/CDA1 family)
MEMKKVVRELLARALIWSGLCALTRRLLWRDRIAILLYHDPGPEALDRHLSYLARFCHFIALSEIDSPSTGKPRVVITLDDGYAGNAKLLPIFIKYDVRPTIFACSGVIGTRRQFWMHHEATRLLGVERLKRLPNEQRLARLTEHGFSVLGEGPTQALCDNEIAAMKPWVDFQAHTRFHPTLTCCTDAESESEIASSRHEIEEKIGEPCAHFAYPNGNYGPREVQFLKAAGYQTARTCDVGWNDETTDRYRLKGMPIDDNASVAWLAAKLTGIPLFMRYVLGGSFNGKMPQF